MSLSSPSEESLLDKLDKVAPASLNQFDAFPKLPSTYKARSGGRGFLTILVAAVSLLLILNDISEYVWGWQVYDFNVDQNGASFMAVNVDLVVNMPCPYLSVDLRDALGDRLYLSDGFRRDGILFDVGQARTLQAHTSALNARQAVAQTRRSRGFFDIFKKRDKDGFKPTYSYKHHGSACRIYGSMEVKKVTANLHITTAGHGYRSRNHVEHNLMNLSHVITDFSFGPYFPEMTQPLKNTFELTPHPFIAYQYFLSVVPTTYIASGAQPVHTNQYSVTHYTRVLEHEQGTPGIFFKFDLEPLNMKVYQRTTTIIQFLIRVVGVVGGVWCCAGWAFRISAKAIDVVSGADRSPMIVEAEATGVSKKKWGSTDVRSRVTRQGSSNSPYASYAGTPVSASFAAHSPFPHTPGTGGGLGNPYSPAPPSAHGNGTPLGSANVNGGFGLGLSASASASAQSFATQQQLPYAGINGNGSGTAPSTPAANPYAVYPATPSHVSSFPQSPLNPMSPAAIGSGASGPLSPPAPAPGPPRRPALVGKDEKKLD